MIKEYGSATKSFLKTREYKDASDDLKSLYNKSKLWDKFLVNSESLGFSYSQIYFVKNLFKHYSVNNPEMLQWLLLHILYQYDIGHLRTSIKSINEDILMWYSEDNPYFNIEDFISSIDLLIEENPTVFGSIGTPFIVKDNAIYINRIEKYENSFLELLSDRLNLKSDNCPNINKIKESLEERLSYPLEGDRLEAIKKAVSNNFLIVSGGPGTGKTTTVISIIRALNRVGLKHILLAAPTGRAAKRVTESINSQLNDEDNINTEAYTLHKLLGIIPNRNKPRFNKERKLPCDAVIIDEASMVDIHMMYRLFDALDPKTKLILVGDKDQLPSVEAGALLGDFLYNSDKINHKMNKLIVILKKFYRSNKTIIDLATLVIQGNVIGVLEYIGNERDEITYSIVPQFDQLISSIKEEYFVDNKPFNIGITQYKTVKDQIDNIFSIYKNFTVLTPSRKGLYGTYSLNNQLRNQFSNGSRGFYHGEPIMITRNDYINKLFNGDRGVILEFNSSLYGFFEEEDDYKIVSITKLVDYETSYVGTVHKSQGSEFNKAMIIIPEGSERLLTREILYTALTRAKDKVVLYSNEEEIRKAVSKKIVRHSGIRDFLVQEKSPT